MCPPGYACPIQDQDVRYYLKLYSWTSLLILCVASLFSLSCWSCVCFFQRILSINHVVIDNVCLDRTIRKSVVSCFWHFVYYRNLCPNGTYSLGAQITCTPCLPGSKCPSISEGPTICPPGYFSERNAAECKLCEAGKQCADPSGKCILKKSQDEKYQVTGWIRRFYTLPVSFSSWALSSWVLLKCWLDNLPSMQKRFPVQRRFNYRQSTWRSVKHLLHVSSFVWQVYRDLKKVQLEFKTKGSMLRKLRKWKWWQDQ